MSSVTWSAPHYRQSLLELAYDLRLLAEVWKNKTTIFSRFEVLTAVFMKRYTLWDIT
jgi:hypothetical protein